MSARATFVLLGLLVIPLLTWAQGSMVSGPMLGYQAHREVLIWLETKAARNATWGETDNAGAYGTFFWGDAAFILMDNRYHREDTSLAQERYPQKPQYDARQLGWSKGSPLQAMKLGHFPFKFIVTGGQVVTSFGGSSETYDYFRREREDLVRFIQEEAIPGVISLPGDVQLTELACWKIGGSQRLYELTSSPLTSRASTSAETVRADEPNRVAGTLVADQNFYSAFPFRSKGKPRPHHSVHRQSGRDPLAAPDRRG